ncbi:nitrate reductase molybdenum cofactor assembly chaperone [Streptosporangium saharense]|uniref:nitrate reductase molybdenum cofactor assembly chaperone n=1 Tax=Streptosporangium saharense TaxID=1706840 RepID=UPI0036869645
MTTPPSSTARTLSPASPVTTIPVAVVPLVTSAKATPMTSATPFETATFETATFETATFETAADAALATAPDSKAATDAPFEAVIPVPTTDVASATDAPVKAATPVTAADRTRLFQLAAVLLTYPDEVLLGAADELRDAAALIEHPWLRGQVEGFLAWLTGTAPIDVQRHYVQTFDLRRRSGLYLTYYLHGDTRRRGMALLVLKQRYRAHGLRLAPGELPDLLPVVLEFAATVGPGEGEAPLRQHRRGVELLRAALADHGTPYGLLIEAITAVLPELTEADREAVAQLALDGPPVESVGLDSLGPDSLAPYPTCSSSEAQR